MSSSDKIPPVLGSPSAPDAAGVAAEVAATAGATEASAPDAVVADVAAASGVVDGAAPTVAGIIGNSTNKWKRGISYI